MKILATPFILFLLILAIGLAVTPKGERVAYLRSVGSALSRLLNALLTGNQLETVSARAGRWQAAGRLKGRILAPIIDLIAGRGHCERSRRRFVEHQVEFK